MRRAREIELAGHTIQVSELTVSEIRSWFRDTPTLAQADFLDGYYFEKFGLTLADLAWLTDLPTERIEELTQEDLQKLIPLIKTVNSDFFSVREKVLKQVQALPSMPSERSIEPAVPLSEQDM